MMRMHGSSTDAGRTRLGVLLLAVALIGAYCIYREFFLSRGGTGGNLGTTPIASGDNRPRSSSVAALAGKSAGRGASLPDLGFAPVEWKWEGEFSGQERNGPDGSVPSGPLTLPCLYCFFSSLPFFSSLAGAGAGAGLSGGLVA